jgi:hypothetical protein
VVGVDRKQVKNIYIRECNAAESGKIIVGEAANQEAKGHRYFSK